MSEPKTFVPGDNVAQRVLIMRHPETVANTSKFFSGRMDVGLTPAGIKQRERAVDALAAFAPDRIFCSPISRARDMAQMAADRLQVPCEPMDDLIEFDFGPIEGMDTALARECGYRFPWPLDAAGRSCPPEGAESLEHVYERAGRVLDALRPLEGRTACVTHGGLMRSLMAAAYGIPLDTFWNVHILNVASLFFTCDKRTFALGGFNLSPEEVIGRATQPSPYDTRDIWGTGRKDLA